MELITKQGFKKTEVGLIPKDWELVKLTDVVQYIHGKAHEQDIDENGEYIVANSKFISTNGVVKKFSRKQQCAAQKGDVLTVLSDIPNGKALAKCFYVEENDEITVNQRICIWRTKYADSKYLYYKLNRLPYFLSLNDGVNQTNIGNTDIEK
jgi:type I restriction enzyme S subunit